MSTQHDPPRKPTDEPWNRPHVRAWGSAVVVWLVLVGLTCLVVHALDGWDHTGTTMRALTTTVARVISGGLIAAWLVGVAWISRATRRIFVTLAWSGGAALLAMCAGINFDPFSNAAWHVEDALTASDGREYRALLSPGFDELQALAVVAERGWFAETLTFVHWSEGYVGQAGVPFRPRRHADRDGLFLEETADGRIAMLWNGTYGPNNEKVEYGAFYVIDETQCTASVGGVEFFRADDVGDDGVLADTVRRLADASDASGWWSDDELCTWLRHDSEWVRDAAASLIEAGGADSYPRGTVALSSTAGAEGTRDTSGD